MKSCLEWALHYHEPVLFADVMQKEWQNADFLSQKTLISPLCIIKDLLLRYFRKYM